MIDLAHRDATQVEDRFANKVRTDEQILQSQEQLEKKYDDEDDYDDDQTCDDIDSVDIQVADKEKMEAMTNEAKELVDLFQKSLGILPSADETSSPTSIPSVRGKEDCKVKSNRKSTTRRMVSRVGEMPMNIGTAQRRLYMYHAMETISRSPFGLYG